MQYQLINDMYSVIFDHLDFYSKVSYAVYLEDLSSINFINKINSPTEEDICTLFECGVDRLKIIRNIYPTIHHQLIGSYIEKFECVNSFKELMNLYDYHDYRHLFNWCITYKNLPILEYIHETHGIHYVHTKRQSLIFKINIEECIGHLTCNKCANEYNQYRQFDRPSIFFGRPGVKGEPGVDGDMRGIICTCTTSKCPKKINGDRRRRLQEKAFYQTHIQYYPEPRINMKICLALFGLMFIFSVYIVFLSMIIF